MRTGTAVDARIFRGSRPVTIDKMYLLVKDSDVINLSFVKHICKSNDFLQTYEVVEILS